MSVKGLIMKVSVMANNVKVYTGEKVLESAWAVSGLSKLCV